MGIPQVSDRIKEAPAHALRAVFSGFGQLLLAAERLRSQAGGQARAADPDGPGQQPDGPGRPTEPASQVREPAASPEPSAAVPAPAPGGPATGTDPAAESGPAAATARSGRRKGDRGPDQAGERWRSLDQTGNVRILSADDPAEVPVEDPVGPAAGPAPAPPAAAPASPAVTPAATPAPPVPVAADPADPAGTTAAETATAAMPPEAATPHQPEARVAHPPETEEPPAATATPGTPEPAGTTSAALPVPGYDALSLPSLRARLRNLDAGQLRVLIAYEHEHAGRADVLAMFERRIAKLAGE
jgi:hypothetical protein